MLSMSKSMLLPVLMVNLNCVNILMNMCTSDTRFGIMKYINLLVLACVR